MLLLFTVLSFYLFSSSIFDTGTELNRLSNCLLAVAKIKPIFGHINKKLVKTRTIGMELHIHFRTLFFVD